MAQSHVDIIRKKLDTYAVRGVIRGFQESRGRNGKIIFSFVWLLNRQFKLEFDPKTHKLTLRNMLPHIPAKSDMNRDIRAYVLRFTDTKLPAHKRVDSKRADVSVTNRAESISLSLTVKKNQYSYGITKLLNLTNALFGYIDMNYIPYLWEHFDVPEE